jgi:hypothetical protein
MFRECVSIEPCSTNDPHKIDRETPQEWLREGELSQLLDQIRKFT